MEYNITHSIKCKLLCQVTDSVICSENCKNLTVLTNQRNKITGLAVCTDNLCIIPGKSNLRHKINYRRNPADHFGFRTKKFHKLLCTAVKSDVTGQCNLRIFWMLCKIRCNLPASVFIQEILSRKSYSINHPSGPYNQVCTSDSFSPFQSQSSNAAHTYSEKCNVLLFLKAITLDQHMSAFL